MAVAALVEFQFIVSDKIRCKFSNMNHFGGSGIMENRTGNWRNRNLHIARSRPVHRIHILMNNTPHMTTLTTNYVFDTETLSFSIHLGIELFHRLIIGKKAKVSTF